MVSETRLSISLDPHRMIIFWHTASRQVRPEAPFSIASTTLTRPHFFPFVPQLYDDDASTSDSRRTIIAIGIPH